MCAREKLCWVDADEMPTEKELINALGKPIVPKLIEKLKKCRTDKGKTVSSIEICDNCDVELECLVLESIDLNIQPSTKQKEETKVMIEYGEGDHMPKIEELSIDTHSRSDHWDGQRPVPLRASRGITRLPSRRTQVHRRHPRGRSP